MPVRLHALQQALLQLEECGFEVNLGHNSVGPEVAYIDDVVIEGEFQFAPEDNTLIVCFTARSTSPLSEEAAPFIAAMQRAFEEHGNTFGVDEDGTIQIISEVEEPELFDSRDPVAYCQAFDDYFYSAFDTALLCLHTLRQCLTQVPSTPRNSHALDPENLTDFCISGDEHVH